MYTLASVSWRGDLLAQVEMHTLGLSKLTVMER